MALADAEVPENTVYLSDPPATTGDLPVGDLSWRLGGDDAELFDIDPGTGVVTLVEQNYEVPQDLGNDRTYRFTLTATDEDNNTATSATTTITITDVIDTARLTLEPTSPTVSENAGTATVTVTLDNQMQSGFTVTASTADDPSATATADEDYTVVSQILTFAGTSGEIQTFTVDIIDDTVAEGDETLTVFLTTLEGAALVVDITGIVQITITDDDRAALTIAPVTVDESEGAAIVTVSLGNTAVQGSFTVDASTVAETDPGTATAGEDYTAVMGQTLTFSGAANETETFTVTIIDDAVDEDDETLTVSLGNLDDTEVAVDITATGMVTITDEADIAGLTLSETVLTVAEGSTTRTYTVVLNTEPSDMVLVSINQDGEVTTNPTSLEFTPGDWNTAQMVTLDAAEDADATHDDTTLTHTATGAATEYVGLTAELTVTVTDNDTAGLTLTPAATTRTVAEGSTNETYTVALTSAPSSTVTVSITPQTGEVTTAPASLDFDDSNWSTPQTVTLTALEDAMRRMMTPH